nr:MAG TPA: hypothetical protein [Caudoviricetes sp.]
MTIRDDQIIIWDAHITIQLKSDVSINVDS